ncbi:MAG: hypothetical protein JO115_06635 [Pseudonocardiales bacterium]|nr:hypothetical protein [Pseudonocardiales bacterium]
MTLDEFDKLFDAFQVSAFHLETHQTYAVPEEDNRLRAFREGLPRPERSVRTSEWLRRIAVTTAAGKQWGRVHIIEHPLSEYLRYELIGYVESQAVGEMIRLADCGRHSELVGLGPDFWLFDHETPTACGVLLHFDDSAHLLNIESVTAPAAVAELERQRKLAVDRSVSLAEYLAACQGQR